MSPDRLLFAGPLSPFALRFPLELIIEQNSLSMPFRSKTGPAVICRFCRSEKRHRFINIIDYQNLLKVVSILVRHSVVVTGTKSIRYLFKRQT